MSMTSNDLSQLINSTFDMNFHNFISHHRVKEVKELLKKQENRDRELLSIAYEAGFSSKATFNSVFKKFTGTTPGKYRKL